MNKDDLCYLPANELLRAFRRLDLSPSEAVAAVADRIHRVDPLLNAFVTVTLEQAAQDAVEAERRWAAGDARPLEGVPITVKDLTDTAGVRTTYGSPQFRNHIPDADGLAWSRLKAAGAILIGKTTTPEFGEKGVTESALTGVTNNPWDRARTAGGSSGGAASSVAAGLGHLAWGSDGGGSIRIPASCCGVVGLKASSGRIPFVSEVDAFEPVTTEGPITRTVADAGLLLSVTCGPHPRAPVALPAPTVDYVAVTQQPSITGWRVAFSPDLGQARVAGEVLDTVRAAAGTFASRLGAEVDEVSITLPDTIDYFFSYWGPAMAAAQEEKAQAAAGDVSFAAVEPFVKRAAHMTANDLWHTITRTRTEIAQGFANVLEKYDVLLTPTMTVSAFPHPGEVGGNTEVDGVAVDCPMIDFHRLTEPPSHAGLPAITLPCGFSRDGLPIGLQIIGRHHADDAVLRAAAAYEAASPWASRRPPLT
jgi:Asp-tRNA(Asn)/Glu-tRNA(Gln) amidotransferase A subunit family amidase